jgi:outer membrane protein TolC
MRQRFYLLITLFATFLSFGQTQFSLDAFVNKVLQNNYGIRIVRNDMAIAKNNNNIGNAGYLPTIALDVRQNLTVNSARQEFLSGQINEADNAINRSFDAGVALEWTFFDGFKMFATDKRLELLEDQARFNLLAEIEMKVYEASVGYYTAILLQKQQRILEESIQLALERQKIVEKRLSVGAASSLELLQTQLDLNADSSAYLANKREQARLKSDLNLLMAVPVENEISFTGELPMEIDEITWEQIAETARNQNTSILLAKANMAIAEQLRKEVASRYYPQIGLFANYNFGQSQNEVGFLLSNRSFGPSVGLYARWDILDQLSRYSGLKNAKVMVESAEYAQKEQELMISSELRKSYESYQWAVSNLSFELRNKVNTESIVQISESAFEAGTLTPLELRELQFGILAAENRLLLAQIEFITAKLNIALTSGDFRYMGE